jgi:Holliday junction resolvase RusA-like endonuclease
MLAAGAEVGTVENVRFVEVLNRPEQNVVTIDLPRPISTNRIWKPVKHSSGARMVRSQEYLAWVSECGFRLNAQRPGHVSGHYALHVYVSADWKGDLSNAIKSAEDLLVSQGVTDDDKLCVSIRAKRANIDGMRLMVVKTKGTQ